MTLTLTVEIEAFVRKQVESGRYDDAAAVVREALRLLEERDRLEWLRAAVAKGDEGEGIPYTPELLDEISREAARRAAAGEPINPAVLPPDDDW